MEKYPLQKVSNVELFNQHLSDMIMELEGIKLRAEKSDFGAIKSHLERMDTILLEIMDARMDFVEKCKNISN